MLMRLGGDDDATGTSSSSNSSSNATSLVQGNNNNSAGSSNSVVERNSRSINGSGWHTVDMSYLGSLGRERSPFLMAACLVALAVVVAYRDLSVTRGKHEKKLDIMEMESGDGSQTVLTG